MNRESSPPICHNMEQVYINCYPAILILRIGTIFSDQNN